MVNLSLCVIWLLGLSLRQTVESSHSSKLGFLDLAALVIK